MTQIETPSYEVHVWRAVILALVAVLLATEVLERPGLWSSYARDLVGPAIAAVRTAEQDQELVADELAAPADEDRAADWSSTPAYWLLLAEGHLTRELVERKHGDVVPETARRRTKNQHFTASLLSTVLLSGR